VFVRLTDLTPVVGAMEQIRTVYPNAMHVERKTIQRTENAEENIKVRREQLDDITLFKAFHKEMMGTEPTEEALQLYREVLEELLLDERETKEAVVAK
jgi:exonuclease SbcD